MRYILHVSSYAGIVPWATHYKGRVEGEYPTCQTPECQHGGTIFNAPEARGKTICSGCRAEIPSRTEWQVEAPWTEAQWEAYQAAHYEGDGPSQFKTKEAVLTTATALFLGEATLDSRLAEKITPGQPGDELWYGWAGYMAEDIEYQGEDGWGTMLAKVPG